MKFRRIMHRRQNFLTTPLGKWIFESGHLAEGLWIHFEKCVAAEFLCLSNIHEHKSQKVQYRINITHNRAMYSLCLRDGANSQLQYLLA